MWYFWHKKFRKSDKIDDIFFAHFLKKGVECENRQYDYCADIVKIEIII